MIEHVPDEARRRERRWTVWWLAGLAVLMVVSLVGGVLVAVGEDGDLAALTAGEWALIVGLPFGIMLVVAAAVGTFVLWRRRRGSSLFAPSPLWELPTQKQRSKLLRDLRRGRPVDPDHHELARRVADDMLRRRGLVWLYVGIAVLQGANSVIQEDWSRWLSVGCALMFLGLAAYFAWLMRRMRAARRRLDSVEAQ